MGKPQYPRKYPSLRLLFTLGLTGLLAFAAFEVYTDNYARHQSWPEQSCVLTDIELKHKSGNVLVVPTLESLDGRPLSLRPVSDVTSHSHPEDAAAQRDALRAEQHEHGSITCYTVPETPDTVALGRPQEGSLTGVVILTLLALLFAWLSYRYIMLFRRELRRSQHAHAHQIKPHNAIGAALLALLLLAAWLGSLTGALALSYHSVVRPIAYGLDQHDWTPTDAVVIQNTSSTTRSNKSTTYHLHFTFAYTIEGDRYYSENYRYLGDTPSDSGLISGINLAHPEGKRITVYVDPDDPSRATFERTFPTILPLGLSALALFFLFLNPFNSTGAIAWALRNLRPPRRDTHTSHTHAATFDLAQLTTTSQLPESGELKTPTGTLSWDLEALTFTPQDNLREPTRLPWDGASLHLSRSRPTTPLGEAPSSTRDDQLHVELRSGALGRLRLTATVRKRAQRLDGLPWMERAGERHELSLLEHVITLAARNDTTLASWPDEAVVPPEERDGHRPRARKPVPIDTARSGREAFFYALPVNFVFIGFIGAMILSVAQPYPEESFIGEGIGLVACVALGGLLAWFTVRSWRRWKGRSPRLKVVLGEQPVLGEELVATVKLSGELAEESRVSMVLRFTENHTEQKGKSSQTHTRERWKHDTTLKIAKDSGVGQVRIPLPVEGTHPTFKHDNDEFTWKLTATLVGDLQPLTDTQAIEVDGVEATAVLESTRDGGTRTEQTGDQRVKLRLTGDPRPHVYAPHGSVHGQALWSLPVDQHVRHAEVALVALTRSGPERVGDRIVFDDPRLEDTRDFALTLPAAPYSSQGEYCPITWYVELILMPVDTVVRMPILVHPARTVIAPQT